MSIESVMLSYHLILCCPLLLLPSVFPSIRDFSNELITHIRWPKYWSFSFNVSPFNEYSELISSMIDWFDILAVQGTLKSLLQHHSSKASVLFCSAFFTVRLSHPYMTVGKTIALTIWNFVSKVMSLLFSKMSRFVKSDIQGIMFFQHVFQNLIPKTVFSPFIHKCFFSPYHAQTHFITFAFIACYSFPL